MAGEDTATRKKRARGCYPQEEGEEGEEAASRKKKAFDELYA